MNPEQILLESYISSTGNEISLEEFVDMINQDPSVLDNLYTWNEESAKAIDQLFSKPSEPKKPLEATTVTTPEEQPVEPKKPLTPAEQMFQDKDPFAISDRERLETTTNVSLFQEQEKTKEIADIQKEIAKDAAENENYYNLINDTFRDASPDEGIEAGAAGLTVDQLDKINKKFDRNTMFNPYQKEVYRSGVSEDGRMIGGGSRITTTIQPYEEELKQAEKILQQSLVGLKAEEKNQKIQDYVFNSLVKQEKEKQKAVNYENLIEKDDSFFSIFNTEDKQIELLKKGVADKQRLQNKQAALIQLRRNRNMNIFDQTAKEAFELNKFLEVINNPNLNYDIVPGQEYVTLQDGRNIPKYIYDKAEEQRENLIGLNNIIKNDEEQLKIAIEDANDANTLLDITRRDYNDIKKFGVSLGLNSLDLLASTVYGVSKLVTAPAELAASVTGQNLGIDPLSDTYTAFTNWKYEVMDDYQKDVAFDDIGFDNWTNIGKWFTQSASQQLPIIISMVATGGISGAAAKAAGVTGRTLVGVQNVSSSAMIGLSSMGGKINDMNYEEFISGEKKYSEAEKLIKGTMYGVAEGTFAYFSTAPILNRGINKINGIGANAAQEEIRTGAFDYLRGTLRKDILPETVGEMFFEGLTTGTQNLIDGRPFFENMNETLVSAGMWGFGMSGTPALYVAGTRNFANNKELKIIQDRQAKKNELLKANARLIDNKLKGNLIKATTDIDAEISKNQEMIKVYDNEMVEAMNTVESNLRDKSIYEDAAKGYIKMQVEMANIRNKVLEVTNDPNKTEAQKETEIEALGKQYNDAAYYQNLFTQTETFGSLYGALAGSSIFQNPFSESRKKYRKVTQQAKDNIKAKKGPNHKITREETEIEAENILIDEKADIQLKKDEAQSKKLGHNFQVYGTKEEATTKISKLYDDAIEAVGKESTRGKNLLDKKIETLQKINKGTLNGLSIQVKGLINLDFVVRDNMRTNRRFTTGLHEQTHRISKELIAANPKAFENLGRQIISYLSFTGQNAALLKMNIDNANIKADGKYDYDEVISSFMELIAEEKVDLDLMDNFVAATGKLFNEGLKNATGGKYSIEFKGQNDILAYFLSFGKKLASGEIDTEQIQELASRINKEGRILKVVEAVESDAIKESETKAETNEALVDIINNPESTRRQRSDAIDTLVADNEGLILSALGFNKDIGDINAKELLDIVVKDQFLVKDMLGKFDKDRAKFSTYVFNLLRRRKKEIYEAAGLDDTKFQTESLDKEEARQVADAKRPDFDEGTDTDTGRELIPVEDLKIVTPELVDEIKDIVTRTLKRTAITKGVSTDAILEDVNKAIEKEITKVIRDKMGPITRNVLGFAPKQYIDFIRDEMMNIVGAMPTNVIKQKAKSKAWAEIFKLTEIGREDIKKVNPDTGKVSNYRKQIFKLEKPDATKFQRYFTRGGYTTLIERQKSLIKPMAQQLARSELARLRQDKPFIEDLSKRTGMTDVQVTEFFVDTVIKDIESELDNTASEILQQDTIKFSETLAAEGRKNPQIKQSFIDGLSSDGFKEMLEANFVNGSAFPLRDAITQYFYEANIDLDKNKIKKIATEISKIDGMQRQTRAALKKFDAAEVADIVAITMVNNVIFPPNYKALELSMGYEKVNYDFKSRTSVNQGRNLALKLYLAVGPEKFMKFFKLGFSGPTGLGGLIVEGVPSGINITKSEFKRSLPTGKIGGSIDFEKDSKGNPIGPITYKNSDPIGFVDMIDLLAYKKYKFDIINTPPNGSLVIEQKNKEITSDVKELNKLIKKGATVRSSLFLNVTDLEQNVFNNPEALKKYPNWKNVPAIKKDAYTKDWYMSDDFQKLSDENKLKKAKEVNELTKESNENLRSTVEELAEMRRQSELTPEEARFFVAIGGKTMASYIKSAAVFLGYPTLDKATVLDMLNLPANDPFVLEHMTPAMRMSLVIYKYLLDPSSENKKQFNKELDNYNTIMLPFGLDTMLREAGLQSSMGLNYKTGDSQWDTRYSELIKLLEFTLVDGTKIGQNSSKFSKMNNNPKTKEANVDLVDKSDVMKASESNNNGITVIETEVLDKALSIARDPNAPVKKIRVFDFDDTLAESNSLVFYTMPDGTKGELTAEQFAERGSDLLIEGADFNFDDFNIVRDGKPGPLLKVAKAIQNARGTEDVFVLTARAPESAQPIQSFLKSVGLEIPLENITGLGNSSEIAKSSWIVNKAAEGYNDFYFADDAPQNVRAVKNALDLMDVKSKTQLVKDNTIKFSESKGKKLEFKTDEAGNINTTFNIGDKKYNFSLDARDNKGSFDVDFNLSGRRDLTGTGNSVAVVRTVYNGLLNAIDENSKIKRIEFSANQSEPSRVRLYTTLANKISKKLGWELDVYETKSFIGGASSFDFELTKPSPIYKALDVVDVKSPEQQAKIKFSETVDQAMNDIIYQKTGIESFKEYSDVRAQAEGRGKRSFDLIPPSAEDFGGLLYKMLSKGKVGDAQWEWMQDNLIKPYNRGVNDLVVAQNTLAADFKALKQSLEGIPKNLKQKAISGFTFEDVTRIITWDKQGIEVEGLSKRDLKDIREFAIQNPEIEVFSDQLIALTKQDGYHYPGPDWLAGTITTDFREGLRTTSRSRYLAQWQSNIDEAFSAKNLNKIEAAFGAKYKEALQDSIERMKSGTNRSAKIGRLEAQFLDYVNGSVGAVMFLNARSAVLQTISTLNFINWGDNNVFAAGRAFANQPQYWKDFMTLMNSDYLVDRRNGLKINVSENEIAEAAKTSKNKAKAVISTLLSKGFVLTQFADSFAIATGGATFYRNRIRKLMKEGMSEAEATKQAFQDFKEVSETSQQSADPSKISMQQASTVGKLILAWGNTPMQYNRIIKKASLDLVNNRGDWKDNISKIIYYGALQNIIFTVLQTGLFKMLFSDDEEEDGVLEEQGIRTANSLIDNLLRGMGIGGAVVSTIKNLGIDIYDRSKRKKPDYADVAFKLLDVAPPIDVKVSKFRQGLTTYEYSLKDPRREEYFNIQNPSYSAAAKVIAATTNVPADRLLQKADNLRAAMDDQNQWWKRAALFLGWPEWQLRSTKEATEFKELMKARRKEYKESKKRISAFKAEPKLNQRAQDSISYFKLNKAEQVTKLDSLGLSKKEIRALRYEKDRVNKLLELMK